MRFGRATLVLAATLLIHAAPASAQVPITTSIAVNTTWGPAGTVYWVKNSININSGVTLTVQPGVIVKFASGAYLDCIGALQAVGTLGSPIYFTSIKDDNIGGDTNGDGNSTVPNNSDWQSLIFPSSSVGGASALTYCVVRYAGYGSQGALVFQSVSNTIDHCTISKSYYGVDCQGSAAPTLSNTSIQASTQTPVVLELTANPSFSSLAFSSSDNGYDAIGVRGGTLTTGSYNLNQRGATVGINPITNVTYVLLGGLTINAGASLTVQHGVVIKPLGGVSITVAGGLTMNGTAAAGDSITITSINDDNYGQPNDTNNNGSITAPNRGDWGVIWYQQGATGGVSYCRFKFGSNSGSNGMIQMTNNSIGVANTWLSDCGHGLALFGVSNPAVTNVQINNCSSTPVLMSVAANPTFTNIGLLGNAINAIGLQGEQVGVDSHLQARLLGGYSNITYYIMNGGLQILTGATLTIDPGIVIKNQISSGGIQIDGALVANGTALNPIVFTSLYDDLYGNPADTNGDGSSTTPSSGNWTYLHFTDTSNDATCLLNYCKVLYASYGPFDGWNPNIWITNASPTITNSTIFKGSYGIRIQGNSAPVISLDTFDNLTAAPIVMSVLSDPQIATNNTYTTNTYNALALLAETLSQDAYLKYRPNVGNPASPTFAYLPTGTITIASGVTLAIAPQVVIKPSSSFTLFNVNGALNMVGLDNGTNRIFITSYLDDAIAGDTTPTNGATPTAGNWGDIVFNDTAVDAACKIRNVKFQFGGSGGNTGGVITTNSASPRCARLEFFQNVTCFTIAGNSSPSLDSLTILNTTGLSICTSLISSPVYGTQITFANCAYLGLGILGETVAQDVTLGLGKIGAYQNLNYILAGNVTIAFGAKWTIAPGIVIKFGRAYTSDPAGTFIEITGALYASGKPESLIVFTSMADDAFGQDAMSDGAATQPSPGQWSAIQFDPTSNDAATSINWCKIRYSGYSSGALIFSSAGPTITNTQITRSNNPGAYIVGASTPTFTNVDFDSTASAGNGTPVQMSIVSDPVFNNCRFQGNWYTALGIVPENIAQDVLWKIRPVAGRLNMPFYLNGNLTIGLGATLTMQPGVIVKMNYSGLIDIQRAFTCIGRTVPESLVVFTSYKDDFYGGDSNADSTYTTPAPGDWGYVYVDGTAIDTQVNFRDCVFRYGNGGSTTGALRCVNSSPGVDSCLFEYNGCGISVEGASDPGQYTGGIKGNSFYGNTYYGVNNTGNSFCVLAHGNWWGSATGPLDASAVTDLCTLGSNAGTGDAVSNNVDYTGWATTGTLDPLLGDVSLNGFVLAYDASLVMQYTVALISLSPTQQLVADVSGTAGITAFDASLILQWVAGKIAAFPALSNGAHQVGADVLAARALVTRSQGTFAVTLGDPRRSGDEWLVPVSVQGTAPAWSMELRLQGGDALTLSDATSPGGALVARGVMGNSAAVALASGDPLGSGEVATLHFPAGSGDFHAPRLSWARVNENSVEISSAPQPALPSVSFLGRPAPNPVRSSASLSLAISSADAAMRTSVRIVDVAGRTLRTLVDGPLAAGTQTVTWNLSDDAGRPVPAGMYFVRAHTGSATFTRRLIVVR